MYTGSGFRDWEIGDIEVIKYGDTYHLFHLIIPNHDYIAHAVSPDGINWRRVKNALFVGDPGEWDDDMLWTMDVSETDDGFEMYYTGLRLADKGVIQKIGRAKSFDLYDWVKDNDNNLPISSLGPYYEGLDNNPRTWLSFRDPYKYVHEGENYLLFCARNSQGPTSRRGCVGRARLEGDHWILQKPLLFPFAYDDIECPCLVKIGNVHYLVGSIREDIKVRYWYSEGFEGPYRSFHSDVLMPQGNYAARIVEDGDHWLVYNFYFLDREINYKRVLPPPKELAVDEKGRLFLKSFYGWEHKIRETVGQEDFAEVVPVFKNGMAQMQLTENKWTVHAVAGYEIFAFKKPAHSFIWEGYLHLEGMGKSGFVLNIDEEGNGYFVSMDFVNGYVQIRRWGFNPDDFHNNFIFDNLQTGLFQPTPDRRIYFRIIVYGYYIEVSIGGRVILTLVDYHFEGDRIGIYSSSSIVSLSESRIHILAAPETEYLITDPE